MQEVLRRWTVAIAQLILLWFAYNYFELPGGYFWVAVVGWFMVQMMVMILCEKR